MRYLKGCLLPAGFAFLVLALAPSHAQAIGWCGGDTSYCFKKENKHYMGQSRVDTCWSWDHMACVPCKGGNSEFAKSCNRDHRGCKDDCVACSDINGDGECRDKHGHLHPL